MRERLADLVHEAVTLPEVLEERCVHGQVEQAECRACVDACPCDAWLLDDDQLGIDTQACDGCGQCAPACPQGAILNPFEPLIGRLAGRDVALIACEMADQTRGARGDTVPCLHSLDLAGLLRFARHGVQVLFVSQGDCGHCPRAPMSALANRVERANRLLSSWGLLPLRLQSLSFRQWLELKRDAGAETGEASTDRRGFMRRLVQQGAEPGLRRLGLIATLREAHTAAGELLPEKGSNGCLPWQPVISLHRCTGCDACVRLCPRQAIEYQGGDRPQYRIAARRCTGCGVCIDVCTAGAIDILVDKPEQQRSVALIEESCRYCGSPYHRPALGVVGHNPQCAVCAEVRHTSRLFQVVE